MNLKSRYYSAEHSHNSNIVKEKNNIYYHNSCNYKTIVSKSDFDNFNIQKIIDDSKKLGNSHFNYEQIDYYVLIN